MATMAPAEAMIWKGKVSFEENDFQDRSRSPDIVRTFKPSVGRKGLTGGELRMQSDGVFWKAGSVFTPGGQLHGSFHLPWSVIVGLQANRISYELQSADRSLFISVGVRISTGSSSGRSSALGRLSSSARSPVLQLLEQTATSPGWGAPPVHRLGAVCGEMRRSYPDDQGLMSSTPTPAKSFSFLVARHASFTRQIAAI